MPDILTPWHRECIERGATLLVVPLPRDEQPRHSSCSVPGCEDIGGVRYKEEFFEYDTPEWCNLGKRLAEHCPVSPGDVLVVHPPCPTQACELERWCEYSGECEAEQAVLCKLRVTDVACGTLDDLDEDAMERCGVRRVPATFTPEIEVWDTVGWTKGLRQSHPSFPSDGYVWLVSVEREGWG